MSKTNSPDLIYDEINKLAQVFPQFVSEGKVDIAWLQSYLDGQTVDGEWYHMDRYGKSKAKLIAREPSTATLRPDQKKSKDRDTTGNMLIEWDNLEVLKLLQKHYYESIKCIYIDPPYNKDKYFIYRDTRKDPVGNYMRITGQIDDEGDITTDIETTGRKHSNWLSMMYPRLYLARKLLKDDGVIFVSIDEDEDYNLQYLLNEIFWEENSLWTIIWDKKNPKWDAKWVAYQHESVLVFAKSKEWYLNKHEFIRKKKNAEEIQNKAKSFFSKLSVNYTIDDANKDFSDWIKWNNKLSWGESAYNKIDKDWNVYRWVSMARPNKKQAPEEYFIPLIHPITQKECPIPERWWRNPQSTMKTLLENNQILFWNDETKQPERKYLLIENMSENIPSIIPYGWSDDVLLKELWVFFDNPKPVNFIKDFLRCSANKDDIILDFFAWSWTTGHAVMDLNAEDGWDRKYILVQLPEPIAENQEAYKVGYRKISEITRDRLLKAWEKIGKWDIGFRFFKLDTSNFVELDPIVVKEWETTDTQLFDRLSLEADSFGIKKKRSDDDVITELLIRDGYNFHSTVTHDPEFPTRYAITDTAPSERSFYLSLEDSISDDDIARFVKKHHDNNEIIFVCKDDAISSGSRLTLANYFKFKTL